jgi:uncharacterized protein with HEPN domain
LSAPHSRDRFLVEEMNRHLSVIAELAKVGRESLEASVPGRYALEHACELLAEAAKHTSREFRTINPDLPWGSLRQLRTAVAHPYDQGVSRVRLERLWRFAVVDGPRLIQQLRRARYDRGSP